MTVIGNWDHIDRNVQHLQLSVGAVAHVRDVQVMNGDVKVGPDVRDDQRCRRSEIRLDTFLSDQQRSTTRSVPGCLRDVANKPA